MTVLELLKQITVHAQDYRIIANESIKRNSHMNNASKDNIKQEDIDTLLVDFINYIGVYHGVDYGLYTKDLPKEDNTNLD